MIALPRERGKCRRYVYGRTPEQAVARFNKAIGAGSARVRPGSISEFFVDEYWPWQTSRVQPETYERYDHAWRISVGPAIGHLRFNELRPTHLSHALTFSGKGGSTQSSAKTVLLAILKLAALRGRASAELYAMAKLVEIERPKPKLREDVAEAAQKLFAAARSMNHWTEGFIWSAMTVGLRKGELCGIKRTDIDVNAGVLTLRRQRNHTSGEKERLKARKAGEVRRIGLPKEILEQMLQYFRPGAIYLVTMEDGRPPAPNHFERHLESVCKAAGVHITPHDLRAAAICRLIDAGASDHEIQEIVGHADREMIEWYRDRSAERSRSGLARLVSSDNQLG